MGRCTMLTKAEVNEQLALLDGWTINPHYPKNSTYKWRDGRSERTGSAYHLRPPDSCGDWKYAGPWLEKLHKEDTRRNRLAFHYARIAQYQEELGCTLTEAIARAALAWKGERDDRTTCDGTNQNLG